MEPRPRPQGHTGLLARLRTLPPIVLIALLLVMLGAGIVFGETLLTRTGTVTRTLTELSVTPDAAQVVAFEEGETTKQVVYHIVNPLEVSVTVTVEPAANPLLTLTVDPPGSFDLAGGGSADVTLSIGFSDAHTLEAPYSVVFKSVQT